VVRRFAEACLGVTGGDLDAEQLAAKLEFADHLDDGRADADGIGNDPDSFFVGERANDLADAGNDLCIRRTERQTFQVADGEAFLALAFAIVRADGADGHV